MILELDEHQVLDGVALSTAQATALARTGAVEARPSARADGTWALEARHLVGVVRAGPIELRVRPKVPVRRLLELILETRAIPWQPDTTTASTTTDVTRAIVAAFLSRAEEALRRGPATGYVTRDDEAPTLRGRLRTEAQLATRPGLLLPLAVRYDELSTDLPVNRLLRTAAFRLSFLPRLSASDRVRLARIEALLADAFPLRPGEPVVEPALRRDHLHYTDAVRLAVLVLRDLSLDARSGDARGLAFLLDMNRLFQDWITARLGGPARKAGLVVHAEAPVQLDAAGAVRARADVLLTRAGRPALVLDVKYKRGAEPGDRYQAIAYGRALGLREAHLVRPGRGPTRRFEMLPDGLALVEHEVDLEAEDPDVGRILGRL